MKHLFQVYAPNEMTAAKANKKIKADFAGAKKHWETYIACWVFTHNAVDGLPPHVIKLLLDIQRENPSFVIEVWSLNEFRDVFRLLAVEDKESWFGLAPTSMKQGCA